MEDLENMHAAPSTNPERFSSENHLLIDEIWDSENSLRIQQYRDGESVTVPTSTDFLG